MLGSGMCTDLKYPYNVWWLQSYMYVQCSMYICPHAVGQAMCLFVRELVAYELNVVTCFRY